jgi:hypothetical protein
VGDPEPHVTNGYPLPLLKGSEVPDTVIAGAVLNVTLADAFSGASVVLGVTAPKANCIPELMPALFTVKLEQVHCFVVSVTEMLSMAVLPEVAATVTALFEQEPPVTPSSVPALIVVAPL